jgi:hypothetical protein
MWDSLLTMAEVNAAYAAAIVAGGTGEGEPAVRAYLGGVEVGVVTTVPEREHPARVF